MNGWDDLVVFTEDTIKDQIKDEQKHLVKTFMKAVTQVASSKGDLGKTPVDSGKLMANTVVSLGAIDDKTYEIEDKEGHATYTKAMLVASQANAFSKIYIQNNTTDDGNNRYALNADYKGWKKSEPYWFFTKSVHTTINESEDRNK